MAKTKTITAANSVYMLSVRDLYTIPQKLQGYAADAAFDTDTSEPVETVMGVDGIMSAGFTPFMTLQTINIMPDNDTSDLFDNILAAMKSAGEVYWLDATIALPSIQKKYALTKGVLKQIVSIPGTRKVLQARPFQIQWEDISPSPYL